ncbi:MAG: hypothetical protein V4489_07865 [Chlamydiota bacterium]
MNRINSYDSSKGSESVSGSIEDDENSVTDEKVESNFDRIMDSLSKKEPRKSSPLQQAVIAISSEKVKPGLSGDLDFTQNNLEALSKPVIESIIEQVVLTNMQASNSQLPREVMLEEYITDEGIDDGASGKTDETEVHSLQSAENTLSGVGVSTNGHAVGCECKCVVS